MAVADIESQDLFVALLSPRLIMCQQRNQGHLDPVLEGGVEPKEGAGWPHLGIPLVAALGTLGASLLLHKFLMGEHDEPRLEKS